MPQQPDWEEIIGLANHTLTTPSLIDFVEAHRDAVPDEVVLCVRELSNRNAIRNDRLIAQLEEAVIVLNSAGITPLLVKGAAVLATHTPSRKAQKLMSDLDLIVHPSEAKTAMNALATIGYRVDYETEGQTTKWYADLKRPHDVGMIDLHQALPGHSFFSYAKDDLQIHRRHIRLGAGDAFVPSPELQALVIMVHDQLQDHDYWTGSIDLRHLQDLRNLFNSSEGVQWDILMTMAADAVARNAIETQLLLLTTLLDVRWPEHRTRRFIPRLQVWRQLLQARMPEIRYVLLPIGLLDYRGHRGNTGSQSSERRSKRWLPRLGSLLFLISLSREYRVGKI